MHQARKEIARVDAVGRVMRTSVHTARFFLIRAQITGGRFGAYLGYLSTGIDEIIDGNFKGMHIDVAVWAIIRTQATSNAPVLDYDLQAIATTDGANRTADHAKRVLAVAAGGRNQVFVPSQAIADQPADAIVGLRAGAHALIATGAT